MQTKPHDSLKQACWSPFFFAKAAKIEWSEDECRKSQPTKPNLRQHWPQDTTLAAKQKIKPMSLLNHARFGMHIVEDSPKCFRNKCMISIHWILLVLFNPAHANKHRFVFKFFAFS